MDLKEIKVCMGAHVDAAVTAWLGDERFIKNSSSSHGFVTPQVVEQYGQLIM